MGIIFYFLKLNVFWKFFIYNIGGDVVKIVFFNIIVGVFNYIMFLGKYCGGMCY